MESLAYNPPHRSSLLVTGFSRGTAYIVHLSRTQRRRTTTRRRSSRTVTTLTRQSKKKMRKTSMTRKNQNMTRMTPTTKTALYKTVSLILRIVPTSRTLTRSRSYDSTSTNKRILFRLSNLVNPTSETMTAVSSPWNPRTHVAH